jgi:photosystem II stability/assembly factor-like uncharacterized protein
MFRRKFLGMVLLAVMLLGQSIPHASAATNCDHAQFVSDITAPDGAAFAPGAAFTKTWRLMNIGTCTWTETYNLHFDSGDLLGAPSSVRIPVVVTPGQMVDVSVNLTAPMTAGHYKGYWKLTNTSGTPFGIGESAGNPIWVDINVVETTAVIYDFVANAPYAQWKSGAGPLPFPGTSGDSRGFAYQVNNPHLEDDSFDSLPGLLTVPQNKYNGYIQATYPEFQVQQGDKLQTLVNCEFGATGCYVTFRIDYLLPSGAQKTLWTWREAYEKRFYRANIDLSSLAGQRVRFVFLLLSTGSASGDRAIWGSPRIVRTGTTQPPLPPPTLTPLPPLPPTQTPIAQPPPAISPSGCDKATFVTDVTVLDGTIFSPGAAFTKTWRLKNSGSCTWTTSYKLMYYSGEQMSAPTAINIPWNVYYGQTIDLTLNMVAPNSAGQYRGFWVLANASGTMFGIGSDASKPFWVEINVAGESPYEGGYNFWQNACSAQWRSGAGILPCPGTVGDRKGFVIADGFSHLEDGTMGPLPSLLMSPENKYNGYIQGFYPAFTVQPGDHFRTTVGCEYGSSCYVTFRLDYMTPTGHIGTFWSWREQNDKRNYIADVDLTPLAGRSVRFILTILATGSTNGDLVRWGGPTIVRTEASLPPTITPVPPTIPPTISPTPLVSPGTVVSSPNIRKLSMIDSSNGWAIANSQVLRTTDSGVTWYDVTMPGVSAVGSGFFQNSNMGWVIATSTEGNGSLYRTTDGGFTWTRFNAPFSSGYIQFLDSNNGFVLEITGAAMNKQSVILYKTTDGGATWVQNYNNDPTLPGASNTLPLGGHKNGMTFRDATTGWVGGDIPMNGYFYLYKTTDGGVTWTRQSLPIPAGYEAAFITTAAPTFFGSNDAVLPVWMTIGAGMRDLFIYSTHDGGTTWTRSSSFARNGEFVDFPSSRDAFSWSWTDVFHVTNDAGNNWTTATPNVLFSQLAYQFLGMDFVSASTGWFVIGHGDGTSSLYRTTDGGSTWTSLYGGAPPTSVPPTAIPPTVTPIPPPTATPSALIGPYAVVRVASYDVLNIRSGAGVSQPVVGSFPPDAMDVMRTGPAVMVDGSEWVEVQNPTGGTGWVNSFHLTEYVTHDAFCADARIAPLIEQLKGSMNQSNGDVFAALVSPKHGVDVRLWAYQPAVNFTQATAGNVFTSPQVYNWGSGPRGEPDFGTFAEIIQPRMLDTLNAPDMETYCDNLTKVYPLATPWPHPNIRFYNLYKPAVGEEFNFRTWLIGFEYINNQPYLYGMVNIVWEP